MTKSEITAGAFTLADVLAAVKKHCQKAGVSPEKGRELHGHFACMRKGTATEVLTRLFRETLGVSDIYSYDFDAFELRCDGDHGGVRVTVPFSEGEVVDMLFLCKECAKKEKWRQKVLDLLYKAIEASADAFPDDLDAQFRWYNRLSHTSTARLFAAFGEKEVITKTDFKTYDRLADDGISWREDDEYADGAGSWYDLPTVSEIFFPELNRRR